MSGTSTPLSASTTLTAPPSPICKPSQVTDQSASTLIEFLASRATSSSTVYIYDVAQQAGFGSLTKAWAKSDKDAADVVDLQTRAGAGLSLVGRLSEGTSRETVKGAILTAYTTPSGLSVMAHSLSHLPVASISSRLVIQVPTVISVGETYALSPSLAPVATALSILPDNIAVILSATPQESVDLATVSYKITDSHVIHLFDHHSASREYGNCIAPLPVKGEAYGTVSQVVKNAGYSFFDYAGDKAAHTVVVMLNGPLALVAKTLAARVTGLGVVIVRVLRPWDEDALLQILPPTVVKVHIFEDVPNVAFQGPLYVDVFGALLNSSSPTLVQGHRIVPVQAQEYISNPTSFLRVLLDLTPTTRDSPIPSLETATSKKIIFISTPKSPVNAVPRIVQGTFASHQRISARLLTDIDVFSKQGGLSASRMILSTKWDSQEYIPVSSLLPLSPKSSGESDFFAILEPSLLKTHSLLQYAKPCSVVLIVTSWSSAELAATLPVETSTLIVERQLRLCTIDAKVLAAQVVDTVGEINDAVQTAIVQLTFIRLYLGNTATEALVLKIVGTRFPIPGLSLDRISALAWSGLVNVNDISNLLTNNAFKTPQPTPLKRYEFNAIALDMDDSDQDLARPRVGSWHDAAKHILFPSVYTPENLASLEEYPANPALRPEVPDRTFLVTTTVNRRLTPSEYDRNVFHLEFDTSGTGLKYAIGEALGVHGWNHEAEVLDFCSWYGVDPDRLVTIPVTAGEGKVHTRTVLQALQQQIDLFGRPPKSFYTDLAAFATNSVDKHSLQFIGSPEGSSTFKKLAEVDTVSFADVLRRYESAKPGIEVLCEMIGDIKPRHYSIASAQSVVGDRVDLLVVTVDWLTPSGSPKFGQCTRYLAGLRVGQKVTVSIKPSVMKLPPDHKQPIIMAGLGTGAAPFRAFLQNRAQLVAQGVDIGPVYYYFGSRYQAAEYLYGEEIEAFILDGTITRAGLAFSRDSSKKVYIQHKMLEDAEALARMLRDQNGVFYLCGPTWPVPDVYEALVGALVKYKGEEPNAAGAYLESLKEEERYVLEVY